MFAVLTIDEAAPMKFAMVELVRFNLRDAREPAPLLPVISLACRMPLCPPCYPLIIESAISFVVFALLVVLRTRITPRKSLIIQDEITNFSTEPELVLP